MIPLAFDLDGLADLFGDAQPELSVWIVVLAMLLALLIAVAVWPLDSKRKVAR